MELWDTSHCCQGPRSPLKGWGICVYVTLQVFASTVDANLEHPFYVVQIRRTLTRQLCLDLCVLDQGMLQRSLGVDLRFLCRACWWGILMPFVASQHILTSRVLSGRSLEEDQDSGMGISGLTFHSAQVVFRQVRRISGVK